MEWGKAALVTHPTRSFTANESNCLSRGTGLIEVEHFFPKLKLVSGREKKMFWETGKMR